MPIFIRGGEGRDGIIVLGQIVRVVVACEYMCRDSSDLSVKQFLLKHICA